MAKPQKQRMTKEHLEQRSGEGYVDSGLQVWPEKGGLGGGCSSHSYRQTNGLWAMIRHEQQNISQSSQKYLE